jgi:hypothetical protein
VTNNDGHWNQEGQRVIGAYLAERFTDPGFPLPAR